MNTQSAPPKHTPGPWITSTGRVPGLGRAFGVLKESHKPGVKGESICVVCKEDNTQPHDVANAMLIAAAPELLAALETLMDSYGDMDGPEGWDADCRTAYAAIYKVRGTSRQNAAVLAQPGETSTNTKND